MAVFLLILCAVYLALEASQVTTWRTEAKAGIQQDARFGLDRIREDLGSAGYNPSAVPQPAVQNATSTSVQFITDADNDNISDLVQYDRDAGTRTIRRSVRPWNGAAWGTASVTTVARNIEGLTFAYSPSAGAPKRIQIIITTSLQVPAIGNQEHQVTTSVFLRNL